MTSSAVSAQGTLVKIATGTGSAKTVTAATPGYPTIVTAAAHGLNAGDVVTLAGLSGNASINGTFTVMRRTTNTFAIDLDTTGNTLTASSATATPVSWTKVANVKTFSGLDGSAAEIDVTNLDSVAKENRPGLPDSGQFTVEVDQDDTDAGQIAVRAAYQATTVKQYQITLPNGKVITFTAWVKKYSTSGAVDNVIKASVDLRITGAYTLV
jgi:predicted secreted protein